MRRRDFIGLLGGAAAWPVGAYAQQPGRVYRVGSLHQAPHDAPQHVALMSELQKLGFIDGQNLIVERRGYGRRPRVACRRGH